MFLRIDLLLAGSELAWNIAITNQPHSEVAALAVFLGLLITDSLKLNFPNSVRQIQPSIKGVKSYLGEDK